MIKSQEPGRVLVSTVLACKIVPKIDILSAKANRAKFLRSHVSFEAEDAWQLKVLTGRSRENGVVFKDFNFALKPQNQCLLPTYDFHWLVA